MLGYLEPKQKQSLQIIFVSLLQGEATCFLCEEGVLACSIISHLSVWRMWVICLPNQLDHNFLNSTSIRLPLALWSTKADNLGLTHLSIYLNILAHYPKTCEMWEHNYLLMNMTELSNEQKKIQWYNI